MAENSTKYSDSASSAAEIAAYDAPFPEERYKAGARQFPALVPDRPDAPGAAEGVGVTAAIDTVLAAAKAEGK